MQRVTAGAVLYKYIDSDYTLFYTQWRACAVAVLTKHALFITRIACAVSRDVNRGRLDGTTSKYSVSLLVARYKLHNTFARVWLVDAASKKLVMQPVTATKTCRRMECCAVSVEHTKERNINKRSIWWTPKWLHLGPPVNNLLPGMMSHDAQQRDTTTATPIEWQSDMLITVLPHRVDTIADFVKLVSPDHSATLHWWPC